MMDVQTLLNLRVPPISVGFLQAAPDGVPAWEGGAVAAGCVFWAHAQRGKTFYTVPADHYNCAVGAYTHKILLPMHRESELTDTIGLMVGNDYLAMEEVAGIPTLVETPAVVAYGPADTNAFAPDVILILASATQAMHLFEAASRAGASEASMATLGRPGCAVLPYAVQSGNAALSLGCAGNRQFTEIADSEFYVSVPGSKWPAVVEQLRRVHQANAAMGAYYRQKSARFTRV